MKIITSSILRNALSVMLGLAGFLILLLLVAGGLDRYWTYSRGGKDIISRGSETTTVWRDSLTGARRDTTISTPNYSNK